MSAYNVRLWIANDEGLYNLARDCKRSTANREKAAEAMLAELAELGVTATPDGDKYTVNNIRKAMKGL